VCVYAAVAQCSLVLQEAALYLWISGMMYSNLRVLYSCRQQHVPWCSEVPVKDPTGKYLPCC
jgi:hypothetical protein